MEKKHTRGSFTGSIGFVLAAAGSAVGLKYLAFPLSCRKRRRRNLYFSLYRTGSDLWIYPADN